MNILKSLSILVLTAFTTAAFAQDPTVATDKNLEVANFDEYKTFTFADHINQAESDMFFLGDDLLKTQIKDEVKSELQALGYEHVEGNEADLLVNFRILEGDTEMTGWVDNFADENYWGPMEMRKEAIGLEPSAEVKEPGDARTYQLDKGTLLIQMVDVDQGIQIWKGYASGVIKKTDAVDIEDGKIARAVELIFDEYNFSASAK
jgi:hypothetical protein